MAGRGRLHRHKKIALAMSPKLASSGLVRSGEPVKIKEEVDIWWLGLHYSCVKCVLGFLLREAKAVKIVMLWAHVVLYCAVVCVEGIEK